MSKFQVKLQGENFPIVWEGRTEMLGFYATRAVKAGSESEAELIAVDMVKSDSLLIGTMDLTIDSDPKIYLVSIAKLGWWCRLGGEGYTFYPMEEE